MSKVTMLQQPGLPNVKTLVFAFVVFFQTAYAQQQIKFTSFTTKNGLSSNTVNALLKDKRGRLWMGTTDGLDKFDGTNFTIYRHNAQDSTSLPVNEVTTLYEDHTGRIWVGTSGGGVTFYDARLDRFVKLKGHGVWEYLNNLSVKAFYEDHQGLIWIATYASLLTLDPIKMQFTYISTKSIKLDLPDPLVFLSFYQDHSNRMWVGTNAGLNLYDVKTKTFTQFVHLPGNTNSLGNNVVKGIVEDSRFNIWIATHDGLDELRENDKNFQHFRYNSYSPETTGSNTLQSIAKTKDDKLWIGTNNGLIIFDTKTLKEQRIEPKKDDLYGLADKSIKSILIDDKNICWLGTYQGGVNKYDPNLALFNLKQSNTVAFSTLNAPPITAFAESNTGQIITGTDGGGIQLFSIKTASFSTLVLKSAKPPKNLSVKSLAFDKQGRLWVGTIQNGLLKVDISSGESQQIMPEVFKNNADENDIYCLKQDTKGRLWVGTNGGGVKLYDPATNTFISFSKYPQKPGDLFLPVNGYVRAITETKNGDIWLGSLGTGVAVYHPKNKNFTVFNKENTSLSSDAVLSIFEDRTGSVWVGTIGGGLNCYNPINGKFATYSEKDGLASDIIGMILQDNYGVIWMSTAKGISSFNPAAKSFKNFSQYNGVQSGSLLDGSGLKTLDGKVFFGGYDGLNYFDPSLLPNDRDVSPVLLTGLKVSNADVLPGLGSPIAEEISIAKKIDLDYGQNFSISFVALNFHNPQQSTYSYKLVGFDKDWNYVGGLKTAYYTNIDPGTYRFQVRVANNDGNWTNDFATIGVIIHPPFWRTTYAYLFYFCFPLVVLLFIRNIGIKRIKRQFEIEQEQLQTNQLIENERKEAERLHELDQLKIKFLTNLSHEFRTPISLIMAPADKLLSAESDPETATQVKVIRRNARRLLNLVNQLLDFRKLEDGELKLTPQPGDLIGFIKDAADSFRDLSELKKINFEITTNTKKLYARFDHDKIERIVFNLLANAFKFTAKGGKIKVNLFFADPNSDDFNSELSITVTDTGVGIPLSDQAKIFDRFFQHSHDESILSQGNGIGLSITKEFVDLLRGTISVESVPGEGSKFVVIFPIEIVGAVENYTVNFSEDALSQSEIRNEKSVKVLPLSMPTVLLIEDDDDFRCYLRDSLRFEFQIIEASDGKEGWQKAVFSHPHLIVSDINLPYMDGVELSKKIKADKRTGHIPIILLTALTGEDNQLLGLKSGANDYLTKPFNFEILNEKIKNLLQLNTASKNTYSKQVSFETNTVDIESLDQKLLKQILIFIEERMTDSELSVEELSKHVGMSRSTLYHKLLSLTGLSPNEYIRNIKLERAAILLKKSGKNVAQVSYETGFATPSYFSRKFRAKFNMLPSEYARASSVDVKTPTLQRVEKADD